ncbi:MAG: oxidoreductase domain protein [Phycisphaerales bacterium]|jgi:hypothetical protein|nr:oxidoreductase domain protein [Phycisphaerales bacterium]
MKKPLSRRRFMYGVASVAGATFAGPYIVRAAEVGTEKIRVACVGVGGKGGSDVDQVAAGGGEVMSLCDIDEKTLKGKAKNFPNAKLFNDFRKMFEQMEKSIDAVTVSIPDHCHGIVAGTAMKMGKHVYCQKPLTQTVYEARALRQLAKDKKVATQMGNQGSAGPGLRRAVEVIQAGVIGHVSEVHVWSNRPVWPQGLDRPQGEDQAPPTVNWDAWLGPAQQRPYNKAYLPFNWRGWYDFGTGALGDMACHTVNMPFRAVKMGYPTVVENEISSRMYPETFPKSSRIRYEFPERDGLPPLKFWWYDGNPDPNSPHHFNTPLRPSADITREIVDMKGKLPISGALLIGEKGKIFSPDDYGSQFYVMLKDEKKYMGADNHEAVKSIPATFTRAPEKWPDGAPGGVEKDKNGKPRGIDTDQAMKLEWFKMIRDGTPSYSNFDIAAYLTEIILLGSIAMRVGEGVRMEWDGPNMKSPNVPEAAKFVKRDSRPGWEL